MRKKPRQRALLRAYAREWTEFKQVEITEEMREKYPLLKHASLLYANSRIEVHIYQLETTVGGVNQVVLSRHGQIEDVTWEEAQRVIRDIFGYEAMAVEMYPPLEYEWPTKSKIKVLWVLPTDYNLPFGLHYPNSWGRSE